MVDRIAGNTSSVSFNPQTVSFKTSKRKQRGSDAQAPFKSVEWLKKAKQPSLSARGFGNKGRGFTFKFSTRPTFPTPSPQHRLVSKIGI